MALSEWPENFRDDDEPEMVEVEIDGEVTAVTAKAVCFDGELWLPKSQCPDLVNAEVGDEFDTIEIPEWLAREKGLDR